jgi:hypothetical protein
VENQCWLVFLFKIIIIIIIIIILFKRKALGLDFEIKIFLEGSSKCGSELRFFKFLNRMISVLGHFFCKFKNFQIWFQNWVYSPSRLEIE